jgi:hypothetical protein
MALVDMKLRILRGLKPKSNNPRNALLIDSRGHPQQTAIWRILSTKFVPRSRLLGWKSQTLNFSETIAMSASRTLKEYIDDGNEAALHRAIYLSIAALGCSTLSHPPSAIRSFTINIYFVEILETCTLLLERFLKTLNFALSVTRLLLDHMQVCQNFTWRGSIIRGGMKISRRPHFTGQRPSSYFLLMLAMVHINSIDEDLR